jgi:hypothetical protein
MKGENHGKCDVQQDGIYVYKSRRKLNFSKVTTGTEHAMCNKTVFTSRIQGPLRF